MTDVSALLASRPPAGLDVAYARCRRLLLRHDPTYACATRRLPVDLRPATWAIYGYVRVADQLVDAAPASTSGAQRRDALDAWEAELDAGLAGTPTVHPVVRALVDAGRRHALPLFELRAYLDAMRVDCGVVRMPTRAALDRYMDGSAGTVGRIMAALLDVPASHRAGFGELGTAFQLANFLRDVREDHAIGRIYLPADVRKRHGVRDVDLAAETAGPGLRAVVGEEVERARARFHRARSAVAAAPPGVRPGIRLACAAYERVLDRIEAIDGDVLGRSTGLRTRDLPAVALGSLRHRGI